MGLVKEFKEFAMKGNVMDMAVGIIIGGAFGKIVSSLVSDVIMPVVSKISGGTNFTDKFIWLGDPANVPETLAAAKESGGAYLGWGSFVQNIIDFLIIALAIFAMIKMMNSAKKKEEEAPKPPPEDITLLREIRDALAK